MRYSQLIHNTAFGRQVDMLISDAKKGGTSPMYCFYNFWDGRFNNAYWSCGSYRKRDYLMGCSISDAYAIRELIDKNDDSLAGVIQYSRPWHCLVCCNIYSKNKDSLPMKVQKNLANIFTNASNANRKEHPQFALREKPPAYVESILVKRKIEVVPERVSYVLITLDDDSEYLRY